MSAVSFYLFSAIRIIVSFLALIYIPGTAFSNLLFFNSHFSPIARKSLSIGTGIVVTSLISSGFLRITGKVDLLIVFCSLSVFSILCWIAAFWRRGKSSKSAPNQLLPQKSSYQVYLAGIVMIIGLMFAINPTLSESISEDHEPTTLIEFYISPGEFSALEGADWAVTDPLQIPVEIENHNLRSKEFIILIIQNDQALLITDEITVEAGHRLKQVLELPIGKIDLDQPLDIFLYNQNQTGDHPHLRLWLKN